MKKIFKSLIFIVLAICPFLIKASGLNYEDTIHYVNNYIYKFPKYSNYLFFNDRLPFIYEKTDFVYDSKFKRHTLKGISVSFKPKSSDIYDIPYEDRYKLERWWSYYNCWSHIKFR